MTQETVAATFEEALGKTGPAIAECSLRLVKVMEDYPIDVWCAAWKMADIIAAERHTPPGTNGDLPCCVCGVDSVTDVTNSDPQFASGSYCADHGPKLDPPFQKERAEIPVGSWRPDSSVVRSRSGTRQ